MVNLVCKVCNKNFTRRPSYFKRYGSSLSCSSSCRMKSRTGDKAANWKGGINNTEMKCCYCGNLFIGRKNRRKYCSPECGHNDRKGKERPKRGERLKVDCFQWRFSIYTRDEFTCQLCGEKKSGHFNAHHIKKLAKHPELAFDISNGITLCVDCHKKVTWKEEQFENLFDCMINGMEC